MTRYERYKELAKLHVGEKFGRLTILEVLDNCDPRITKKPTQNKVMVRCVCDCGIEKICALTHLKNGSTSSCGCLHKEKSGEIIHQYNKLGIKKTKSGKNGLIREPHLASAWTVYTSNYKDGNISFDDFILLSQQDCFYCGISPSNTYNKYSYEYVSVSSERKLNANFTYNGLDRVDNTRGHDVDNVVPCCEPCNRAKLKRTKEDFFQWVKRVYEHSIMIA